MPKISVLIATYNHQHYIKKSIISVLEQTFQDFEIIICDDGSDYEIDKEIKSLNDGRITLLRNNRLGPSLALNSCLRVAKGKYIAIFSGDDICLKNRLEHQLNEAKDNIGLYFSVPKIIGADDEPISPHQFNPFAQGSQLSQEKLVRQLFEKGNFLCAPSAFGHREVFENTGFFNPSLIQLQDFEYWIRVLSNGFNLYSSRETTLLYRWSATALTEKNHTKHTNLSSPENHGRTVREKKLIYKDFLSNIPDHLFTNSFGDLFRFNLKNKEVERKLNEIVCLKHIEDKDLEDIIHESLYNLTKNLASIGNTAYRDLLKSLFQLGLSPLA